MKKIPIRKIKASLKEPGFPEPFSIRDLKILLNGKDMVQELHRHDFFFMLVLKKGYGLHEIDFTPYKITDNNVFFMRPGQVHHLALKAGSSGYLVGFGADFYETQDRCANQLLRRLGNMNYCSTNTAAFAKMLPALDAVFLEYNAKQEGYEEMIKANLCIFFMELVRQRHGSKKTPIHNNTYARERLDEFLALLEIHIAEHKQVAHYASMLKLSPYQLNGITKTLLGKTCSVLINEHIILEAKRHILATTAQVKEIAYHLGYDDVSYFIRFFKKQTGYSPEAFRQHFK